MQTKNVQVEVLLITGTSFSTANLCSKGDYTSTEDRTEKEQLGEACWNGLLQEMLPEVYLQPANDGILYLWQIKEAASFLEIELGEFPAPLDKYFSITPHSFFSTLPLN
jgi:hypothetical protein